MNAREVENPKVIVTGGTPDWLNRNVPLRGFVSEGFSEILGKDQVLNLPIEVSPVRVREGRPQLVLVFGSCLPDLCDYTELRESCKQAGSLLAFWVHDDPYEFDSHAKFLSIADFIFSNDRWASEHYHRENVFHLPLAASAEAHTPMKNLEENGMERDVFFCGVGYQNRNRMLADLAGTLIKLKTEVYGDQWDVHILPFCRNQRIPNEKVRDYYASSKIVLNLGRDFSYANKKYFLSPSTPGPRTFEAAMAGACQMIFADSLEVMDYFNLNTEIMLFNDPSEFKFLLMDLLNHPEKRDRIGSAARTRCLQDHTYAERARKILEYTGL